MNTAKLPICLLIMAVRTVQSRSKCPRWLIRLQWSCSVWCLVWASSGTFVSGSIFPLSMWKLLAVCTERLLILIGGLTQRLSSLALHWRSNSTCPFQELFPSSIVIKDFWVPLPSEKHHRQQLILPWIFQGQKHDMLQPASTSQLLPLLTAMASACPLRAEAKATEGCQGTQQHPAGYGEELVSSLNQSS